MSRLKLNLIYYRQSYKVIQKNIFVMPKKNFKFVGLKIKLSTKSMIKHFFVTRVVFSEVEIFFEIASYRKYFFIVIIWKNIFQFF